MLFLIIVLALLGPFIAAGLVFIVYQQAARATDKAVKYADAKSALDRLADWAKWIVTIQTGAMGLIGLLKEKELAEDWENARRYLGVLALIFFGVSIIAFGWLLAALPSIQQRLEGGKDDAPPSIGNNIYRLPLFDSGPKWAKLEFVSAFSHYFGLAGFAFFALFFITGMVGKPAEKDTTLLKVTSSEKAVQVRVVPPPSDGK